MCWGLNGFMTKRSRKKSVFSGSATRSGGWGGKGLPTKKKELFLNPKKIQTKNVATKFEGGSE